MGGGAGGRRRWRRRRGRVGGRGGGRRRLSRALRECLTAGRGRDGGGRGCRAGAGARLGRAAEERRLLAVAGDRVASEGVRNGIEEDHYDERRDRGDHHSPQAMTWGLGIGDDRCLEAPVALPARVRRVLRPGLHARWPVRTACPMVTLCGGRRGTSPPRGCRSNSRWSPGRGGDRSHRPLQRL